MATTPTSTIGGLVSGLDTATIINQLMSIEATSQNQLKSKMSTEQTTVKVAQALNAKIAALATQATALAKPATWASVTATSDVATVAATATADATTGTLQLTVNSLASAHRLSFSTTAALTDVVASGSTTVNLTTHDGTVTAIDTGDGSLAGLVAAVNASGKGVRATTVALDNGQQRLRIQSEATGATSDFTLTNLDGSPLLGGATVTAGTDASITIEGDTLHSSTNTFAGSLPGIDVTIGGSTPLGTTVTVSMARDATKLSDSVKAYVAAVNGVLADIDSQTGWNATTKTSGPLNGSSAVRALRTALLEAVYPKDGSSMAAVGVQLDRNGALVFDETTFAAAYARDAAATQRAFTSGSPTAPGFAERVKTVAVAASDSITGTVTAWISGSQTDIKRLQSGIEDWDVRLALRRSTLQNTFTNLETAMSRMRSQSDWLASQLASMSVSSKDS